MDTPPLLVSTAWLAEHLNDEALKIVDIRGHVAPATEPPPHYFAHHSEYAESHIPGAVFVDWTSDIVEPGSKSYDVAAPERYAALMSQLGIGDQTMVVAYDDAAGMFAARLWWTLNYYGHSQVAVLDGGWQKWLAEGRPVSSELPQVQPATFKPRPNAKWLAVGKEIADALGGRMQLLDVRSPAEFAGEASRAKRKGHIPGAVNLPRTNLVADDGTLLPAAALKKHFSALGLTPDSEEVIVYCNGGVSASYGMIALLAAGIRNVRVYDGSWKDWGNDDTYPVDK